KFKVRILLSGYSDFMFQNQLSLFFVTSIYFIIHTEKSSTLNFCHNNKVHTCVSLAGEHESVLPESMVNAVLINKKVRNSKSFTERVPVRKVRLEVTSNGTAHDSSLWHTHLGIHRLAQAPCKKAPWDLSHCRSEPCSFDNQRLISKENGTLQHKELEEVSELSMLTSSSLSSFSKESGSTISGTCQEPAVKSDTSAVWLHHHISSTKYMPHPEFQKQQGGLGYMSHSEDTQQ
uniref:TBC1 domain-containing protein n=1 Tax=Pavo cristatus TaxID=9049 RepID=A0A8C9F1Y0_PAVCR